jgi:protoporphyrinogen/coproporphyrinogen III oxidase
LNVMPKAHLPQVIVIGAGIAGLTAAHFLAKAGMRVKVLEASGRVGGRMTTDAVNGFLVDRGAQFLGSGYGLILSLANELGLKSSVCETTPWTAIVRNGKICRMRSGNPLHALTSGLLGLSAWTRLGWRGRQLRKSLKSLPLNDYSQWSSFDTESASSWTNRMIDPSVTEYLIEPMLQGFYFQEPEETSLSLSMVIMAFGYRRGRILSLSGGIGKLPEAIASRLDVVLDSPVTSIESGIDSVTITTGTSRMKADYMILTIPATDARRLYSSDDETTRRLMATPYSANINIAVMTNDGFHLPDSLRDLYGLLIPRSERLSIACIGIESNKNRDCAPQGQLLNIMLSHTASTSKMSMTDDAIVQSVVPEAEKYFPGLSAHISMIRIYRWKHAEPYSHVGRAKDLLLYRKNGLLSNQRVLLAGDYMSMPFTEGAAESGRWAAEQICNAAYKT